MFFYTNGYMSAVKNSEIIKFMGKRIEQKIIICSEITQTQKDKAVCSFSHEDVGFGSLDTHI